ncbi:glycine zipper 2TM domain-containing protein [Vulcaniibacterium tengchongense]|uniref:Uncharacterized protein YcfJ n=1 Tax=Vulcaniibacterium tengchongense TaxID=1273429 RepID=A0A3N4W776_9GAMM|nr:glycine zipper 2TM domain-containing protein [Vulcaniibacterium tengchongense]RPE81054.1 uncharacterized protein YcfJ [Vulcaniibacterium tengchongense]
MNRPLACTLVLALAAAGAASAQSRYDPVPSYSGGYQSDYARVVRVDPVFERYADSGAVRCYERPTYVGGDGYRRDDGRYDPYGAPRSGGSETGRTVATVVGGIVGAVVGSQVGGGSARYATSAIGSMVGGMAGRQIYEQSQRDRVGSVRVCDPEPAGGYPAGERGVDAYDVTYEYAGRTYLTRMDRHPGDRIRVRVDVRPDE